MDEEYNIYEPNFYSWWCQRR